MVAAKNASALSKNGLYMIISEPEDYTEATVKAVKELKNAKASIAYVAINKPADVVCDRLEENGIDTKGIMFIDCASAAVKGEAERTQNTIYVAPQNLTGVSLAISELLAELPDKRAVVFDSINALVVYNPLPAVEKFAHFISGKIRLAKATGVLMATTDVPKEMRALLEGVCDETIKPE